MVKSYNFGTPTKYYDLKLSDFKGVDFSSYPSEVASQRSPEAVNIFSSKNGIIEKRTGFKAHATLAHSALVATDAADDIRGFWQFTLEQDTLKRIDVGEYDTDFITVDIQLVQLGDYLYYRTTDNGYEEFTDDSWEHVLYQSTSGLSLDNVVRCEPYGVINIVPLAKTVVSASVDGGSISLNKFRLFFFGGGVDGAILFFKEQNTPDAPMELYAQDTWEQATTPNTFIACDNTGGGEAYEDVSLLTPKRKVSYQEYYASFTIPTTYIDTVQSIGYHGVTKNIGDIVIEYRHTDGTWKTLVETTDFTVNRTTGVVTVSASTSPLTVTGEDNMHVTYSYQVSKYIKPVTWNTSKKKFITWFADSNVFGNFGLNGNSNYLFVAKNNIDRYINLDSLYSSDLAYSTIGTEQADIIGYSVVESTMIVHKERYNNQSTMYIRSAGLDDDGNVIFPLTQGASNISAVSKESFSTLRGEPMFLSEEGVYAVTTNNVTNVQALQSRSYYIDRQLESEPNLQRARAISNDGYWYLFLENGHVYVADSRRKSYEEDSQTESYQYDWYYWEGVVAKAVFVIDGVLYFANENKIYTFNEQDEENAYADVDDDGELVPVVAYWTTPIFYMGNITYKKSLKNLWARLATYDRSGVDIYYRLKGEEKLVKSTDIDLFDFADIDFTRFSFNTDTSPHVVVTNRMERQFMSIQFMFKNERAEPFGLLEVVARYKINSEYKGG